MEVKKHEKPGSLSPVKPALKRDEDCKNTRSSSKTDKELRLPPEKSPSDDGAGLKRERRLSKASESSKETFERQDSKATSLTSPKVSRKYFTNWRQACDKTKDKTKELLKRWRTLPESEVAETQMQAAGNSEEEKHHGWSVHVWNSVMSKDSRDKEKYKVKPNQQDGQTKTDVKPASDENHRKTRMSNVKEDGFYSYKNMVTRNVKSQDIARDKIVKRVKKRVKNKRSQK